MMIGLDPSIEKHRKGMSVMYDGKALASEKVIDVSKSDAGSFYTIDEGEEGEQENDKPNAAGEALDSCLLNKVGEKVSNMKDQISNDMFGTEMQEPEDEPTEVQPELDLEPNEEEGEEYEAEQDYIEEPADDEVEEEEIESEESEEDEEE